MGIRGSRCGHEVHRVDDETRCRPLPVAEQIHRLHRGQQHEQDERGRGVLQVVRQAGRSAGLLLLLLGQPQPFRQQDAFDARPVGGNEQLSEVSEPWTILPPFTTSLYQSFQTAQLTELLTQFGPIAETWIDIPGVLGRGYRTFLYGDMARLQPQTVIMMNSGIPTAATTTSTTPGRRT